MLGLDRRYGAAVQHLVEAVKQAVREQGGHVSDLSHGDGVAEGLAACLGRARQT